MIDIISRKLIASAETLEAHLPASASRGRAINKIHAKARSLTSGEIIETSMVRGVEGDCAATYFAAWKGLAIEWMGTSRRPVPDEWNYFGPRSSLANGTKPKNYNASHPINVMLNYAYTVKLAHLQIEAIADGYDPTVGILHHSVSGKPSFIFDLIEPERPKVDAAILGFVQSRKFAAADFVIRSDGVCRLSPQLARAVVELISQ
jgi:CRISPR-associated protein Cas1